METVHFKKLALDKYRELGIDGAVEYFRNKLEENKKNIMFDKYWIKEVMYEMCIDYIVNDLGE